MQQWVYSFGGGQNKVSACMRDLLGGKGANLAEMAGIDLPVLPGFTITSDVYTSFYQHWPSKLHWRRAFRQRYKRPEAASPNLGQWPSCWKRPLLSNSIQI